MAITFRPATERDQKVVTSPIRSAHLNPRKLHRENFLVAEDESNIIRLRLEKADG